jgi:hypothetical protein
LRAATAAGGAVLPELREASARDGPRAHPGSGRSPPAPSTNRGDRLTAAEAGGSAPTPRTAGRGAPIPRAGASAIPRTPGKVKKSSPVPRRRRHRCAPPARVDGGARMAAEGPGLLGGGLRSQKGQAPVKGDLQLHLSTVGTRESLAENSLMSRAKAYSPNVVEGVYSGARRT